MTFVETKMISGWKADEAALKELPEDNSVELQWYEMNKNDAVQLYFNSVCVVIQSNLSNPNLRGTATKTL